MTTKKIACVFLLIFTSLLNGQINKNRKTTTIQRVSNTPKIDGKLSDDIWKNIPVMENFIMKRPENGKKIPKEYQSIVKIAYDDSAIYIGAVLFDPNPSKIPTEFSTRDNLGNADYFMVTINPNDDGQNPFAFTVETTGNQADAKISNGNFDWGWSAVWSSEVTITNNGWVVEMKIPYRALRFANKKTQSWGVNFHREIRNLNANYTWNHIDNTKGNWTQYDGLITNITDIHPPSRLNLCPYATRTTIIEKDEKPIFDEGFGMDVKYGLSENFTLDATLIPDFSQAGFDNIQLNLGPFEQRFTEQRQFFTEGTELFEKGDLFYSRRIGSKPINKNDIETSDDEKIIENPKKTQLLNAVKVSGRTKSGLGIGFFNAITDRTKAIINNTKTNKTREVVTQSLTNYNIIVLDQQFNKNSSVSITNTNVFREGNFRDANATALTYHVETKDSNYYIDGAAKMSHINTNNDKTGYYFDTSIGKGSGNWRGEIGYNFSTKDYDINDLGYLGSNNLSNIYWNISYRILQPTKNMNENGYYLWGSHRFLKHDGTYVRSYFGVNTWFTTKERFSFGGNLRYRAQEKDYFEAQQPSTNGVFFIKAPNVYFNNWGSTDYRKKLALDYSYFITKRIGNNRLGYGFNISPRYRFSNQFSLVYNLSYNKTENDRGYVTDNQEDIIFGIRDRNNYENTLSGKFSFSTKSALNLSFRHNWSKAMYSSLHKLNSVGGLSPTTYNENENVNFNSWNIDLNYQWQFAPGSMLTAFYRNTIFDENTNTTIDFSNNLNELFKQPMKHIFSLKIVYFLDYNEVKKFF